MSNGVLTVGVVGYGYWGPNLVRNFSEVPNVVLKAVVDLNRDALQVAKRRHPQIDIDTTFEALIADPTVDAVVIATPAATHFDLALAALRAGKHVWLEKPMTETSEQARILVAEADQRGRVLMVDHTFVFSGAVRKIAELAHSGELGKHFYYDSTRVNLGLFQKDANVIQDLAVHDFSILDYVFREHPVAVSASGINHFPGTPENLAYITLFYQSGFIAHTNVSWLAPVKVRQILVGASNRMITYDDLQPSEKLKVYDKGVTFTDDPQKIYEMRVGYRTGDMWAPKLEEGEALRLAAQHFTDCALNGKVPVTDGRFGERVVQVIEAATASMQQRGVTVQVPQGSSCP